MFYCCRRELAKEKRNNSTLTNQKATMESSMENMKDQMATLEAELQREKRETIRLNSKLLILEKGSGVLLPLTTAEPAAVAAAAIAAA
jgi:hypothetical protein